MEEKDYQPILEAEEQPEEGFVPYCGSEEFAKRNRPKMYFIILGILAVAAVVGISVLLIGRTFNLYHTVMDTLQFDYRNGEEVTDDLSLEFGGCASALSEQIGRQQVTVDAFMYLYDEDGNLVDAVSEYHNVHNVNEDVLTARSGSKSWAFSQKFEIRLPLKNGNPPVTDEYRKPLLYELMFDTVSHDAYIFECYDTVRSSVNDKPYICEIWLLADYSLEEPSYYTLYRYYQNDKLAGLRVLNARDAAMEVYDIRDYTIG